jgi:hypothetical protein
MMAKKHERRESPYPPAKVVQQAQQDAAATIDAFKHEDTETILTELARRVETFEVHTHFRFDGYPSPYRGPERTFTYSITFECFDFDVQFMSHSPDFATIREAAIFALEGAIAGIADPMPGTHMTWDALLARIAERTTDTQHGYVTDDEAYWLVANDLWQPGHTICRYSSQRDDYSDLGLARADCEYAREMCWM